MQLFCVCIVMTTDHYVFPEDGPEDESAVVRTVEEENLFTVAFPDVVQLFHKETTEAKDNKLKSMSPFVLQSHSETRVWSVNKCCKLLSREPPAEEHTRSLSEAGQASEC